MWCTRRSLGCGTCALAPQRQGRGGQGHPFPVAHVRVPRLLCYIPTPRFNSRASTRVRRTARARGLRCGGCNRRQNVSWPESSNAWFVAVWLCGLFWCAATRLQLAGASWRAPVLGRRPFAQPLHVTWLPWKAVQLKAVPHRMRRSAVFVFMAAGPHFVVVVRC